MPFPVHLIPLSIPVNSEVVDGTIAIPDHPYAMVLFAHGSGSSRLSPRNKLVASYLNHQGLATFLFDLLTEEEDRDYQNRFNIELLTNRLIKITRWIQQQEEYKGLRIGYFGASTGAAAALKAAGRLPEIAAVVSRGGRPDLAMTELPFVKASTLLIVGHLDTEVLKLNQKALRLLQCQKKMEVVPGATHLFEEKGTMEKVCVLAAEWFEMHFQRLALTNK